MLLVLGASHHDLELTQLEQLCAEPDELRSGMADLAGVPGGAVQGVVTLATCNRLEIYLDAERFHDAVDDATERVAKIAGMDPAQVAGLLKVRVGAPVAAHLFTVSSGLDSMVVGEAEISGQVSQALIAAQADRTVTPTLNSLFQSASRTAKQVATSTDLGAAGRSVASVAIDLVPDSADLSSSPALIIGTGAYARVVAASLRARGCTQLSVYSPSGRAESFAATHHAAVVVAEDLSRTLAMVDIVVACSGQQGPVLDGVLVGAAADSRRADGRDDLSILDLALKSDVGAGVRGLPGVRVIDLNSVGQGVTPEHREAITAAQDVVITAVAKFEDDQAARALDPAVIALRQHVAGAVEKEMARLRVKYDSDVAADVELAMHRVTQSLLHTPTLKAKELARTGESAHYVQALHTLFGIELPPAGANPHDG